MGIQKGMELPTYGGSFALCSGVKGAAGRYGEGSEAMAGSKTEVMQGINDFIEPISR